MADQHSSIDGQPTTFGTGWISGVLAVLLAGAGLGAVICFLYWDVLTMEEAREHVCHTCLISAAWSTWCLSPAFCWAC